MLSALLGFLMFIFIVLYWQIGVTLVVLVLLVGVWSGCFVPSLRAGVPLLEGSSLPLRSGCLCLVQALKEPFLEGGFWSLDLRLVGVCPRGLWSLKSLP